MELTDTKLRLETPEGVELALRVAGPVPRALAWLVDILLRGAVYFTLLSVLGAALPVEALLPTVVITLFLLEWGWAITFEVRGRGATPGKRALGLRVVRDDGTPVGWQEAVLRNITRLADFLPFGYMIGLISMASSGSFKRLGDRVAGTLVIHHDVAPVRHAHSMPAVDPVRPDVGLSAAEQEVLVEFALRARDLTPSRRVELADHAFALTGAKGTDGVRRLAGMARWSAGEA
jgi:uncharacterized RDD family membrane protein YckC